METLEDQLLRYAGTKKKKQKKNKVLQKYTIRLKNVFIQKYKGNVYQLTGHMQKSLVRA